MESSNSIKFSSNIEMRRIHSFSDVQIRPQILQTLQNNNIPLKPVPQFTLDHILSDTHLLIISASGLGRGLSTIIGILNSIDLRNPNPQALILSPTHSLAEEYFNDLNLFKQQSFKFTSVLCVGGAFVEYSKLKSQIIVGTCGKILGFLNKGKIMLNHLKFLVCDIVNELFKTRLAVDTEKILGFVSKNCVHWYLASKGKDFVKEKYFERVGDQGVVEVKIDEGIFECMKFFVRVCDEDEQEAEVKKIVSDFGKKSIIFSQDESQLISYNTKLAEFSPKLLASFDTTAHQNKIIDNFQKEKYNLLLCQGRGKFVRRLSSSLPSKLIFLDIPSKHEFFVIRLHRYNFNTDDEVYIIIPPSCNKSLQKFQSKLNLHLNPL